MNAMHGLPFTRSYSYEEIGDVSRGARLYFDRFGRLAVIQRGAFAVLNDSTWIDLADHSAGELALLNLAQGPDGAWYYGALGSWGEAIITDGGRVRAKPLVPSAPAKWAETTSFTEVLSTTDGVYFSGWDGVVFYDPATHATRFIAVPEVSAIFQVGNRVFVSSHRVGIEEIDRQSAEARALPGVAVDMTIDQATSMDARHTLLATTEGQFLVFDGQTFSPWPVNLPASPNSRVSALRQLVDGGVAVAISGQGLFVVTATGQIQHALTTPEYQRITGLTTREAGVLWVATETGVEKVLYGTPVTLFGQRLGLPISWPQIVRWRDRILVASGGRVYQAIAGANGKPGGFQLLPDQPERGSWAITARGPHLLIGNAHAVFAREGDGPFEKVLSLNTARLVLVSDTLCYVIGTGEMTALSWDGRHWRECAARVPGVGYPSVVHAGGSSAWLELGPNRAARVTWRDGALHTQVFESFPWSGSHWVNLGMIGDIIVMSGPAGHRLYFDERKGVIVAAPELDRRLARAPLPISRIWADESGKRWATHERGIFTITHDGAGDHFDIDTFDLIDDRSPFIHLLPGGDVWVSSGLTLYHVENTTAVVKERNVRPILISLRDGRHNAELPISAAIPQLRLPYRQNNVELRFFAGSYDYRRVPIYEFKFDRANDWTSFGNGSQLNFPELREGIYHLTVRLVDGHGTLGAPVSLRLNVLPPWYRTWYAYAAYLVGAALALLALIKWSIHRTHARNVVLAQLVERRTDELTATMEKLNEETRNAATLAERHRLAGEIHDSLQQGLSGLMLQLDATLKLPALTEAVRSRLIVARNMVSFTRHEVQHAVWDMETPLLDNTEVSDALRKLTTVISAGSARVTVRTTGEPRPLSQRVQHDLIRIAQEAITNAVRHAAPQEITVALAYDADGVALSVTDDGCGFDPDRVLARGIGHFGLRGLRARAQKIEGDLEIDSRVGGGTTIRVRVTTRQRISGTRHAVDAAR